MDHFPKPHTPPLPQTSSSTNAWPWLVGVGCGCFSLIGFVSFIALLIGVVFLLNSPDSGEGLKMVNELEIETIQTLKKEEFFSDDEQLLMYYSSYLNERLVVTEQRLVYDWLGDRVELSLDDIKEIRVDDDSYPEFMIIEGKEGEVIEIELSSEDDWNVLEGEFKDLIKN